MTSFGVTGVQDVAVWKKRGGGEGIARKMEASREDSPVVPYRHYGIH